MELPTQMEEEAATKVVNENHNIIIIASLFSGIEWNSHWLQAY